MCPSVRGHRIEAFQKLLCTRRPHGGGVGPCMSPCTSSYHREYVQCRALTQHVRNARPRKTNANAPNKPTCLTLPPFLFFSSFPRPLDAARMRGPTAGGAACTASSEQTDLLHLRAPQRAPMEPLKPVFPNMKEGNQNREMK